MIIIQNSNNIGEKLLIVNNKLSGGKLQNLILFPWLYFNIDSD